MVPYYAKLLWMSLMTIGTVVSWFVLVAFSRSIRSWWLGMIYCSGLSVLVLAFDLGAIYDFNPQIMPRSFCLGQMIVVNISAFVMLGVVAAFNLATTIAVVWPTLVHSPRSTLLWHNSYLILIIGLPILSTFLQTYFMIKYNAFDQVGYDGTMCDITEPIWPKLLGYGGMPMVLTTPSMVLAAIVIYRINKMHKAHSKLWNEVKAEREFQARMGIQSHFGRSAAREPSLYDIGGRARAASIVGRSAGVGYSGGPGEAEFENDDQNLEVHHPEADQEGYPLSPISPVSPISPMTLSDRYTAQIYPQLDPHPMPSSPPGLSDRFFHTPLHSPTTSRTQRSSIGTALEGGSPEFPTFALPDETDLKHQNVASGSRSRTHLDSHSNATHDMSEEESPNGSMTSVVFASPHTHSHSHSQPHDHSRSHLMLDTIGLTPCEDESRDANHSQRFKHDFGGPRSKLYLDTLRDTKGKDKATDADLKAKAEAEAIADEIERNRSGRVVPLGSPIAKGGESGETLHISMPGNRPGSLMAQIWRLLLFQSTFFGCVVLLAAPTWVSLFLHRPPRVWGSDHVAGILTAWAPVFVFGHSPPVIAKYKFWKKESGVAS